MNKICTSIEQSRILMGFGINIDTADMYWWYNGQKYYAETKEHNDFQKSDVPAWSLSALLEQMPCMELVSSEDNHFRVFWKGMYSDWHESAIDACVELLLRVRKEEEQ